MEPGNYTLQIYQGTRFYRVFTFPDSLDLTGAVVDMEIRQTPGGTKIWDNDDLNDGDTLTVDTDENTITLTLAPDTTKDFHFDQGVWDLDINGDRWLKGKVLLEKRVNRG